ncbi:MAG TPA: DUF2303 family protein [Rubrivivax sp.]|nr:DUF2303 family protein [Rubrivivax sp.]
MNPAQPTAIATAPATADQVNAVARLAVLAQGEHRTSVPHARPFVLVPEGYALEPMEPTLQPRLAAGTVKLRDADSFVRYLKRFCADPWIQPLIYAQIDPARFVAVLDEHKAMSNPDIEGADPAIEPGWREWRADFTVPASREWLLWNSANRKLMTQTAFAEFLEDNLPDVAAPSGAELLEMALNFEATKNGAFRSTQRLQDGSVNFAWVDETAGKDGGIVRMPPLITLRIPVFENEQPSELQARLKYRLADGRLTIWFELVRPHKVLEAAFRGVWKTIEEGTGLKPLLGAPE